MARPPRIVTFWRLVPRRNMTLYLRRKHSGLKLDELAQLAGMKSDASVAGSLRRYENRLQSDRAEQKRLASH